MNGPAEAAAGPDKPAAASPEGGIPLRELDDQLSPLRRTVAWALGDGHTRVARVRYLGAIGERWIGGALALDVPHAIRDLLAQIKARLSGFDAGSVDERGRRLGEINQALARLDALLGLPLVDGGEPAPAPKADEKKEPRESKSSRKRSKGRSPRRKRGSRPDKKAPPEPTARGRSTRLGDPQGTGSKLADSGLPDDLVQRLDAAEVRTAGDLFLLPPADHEVVRPIHGAGRAIPAGRAAVGGRVQCRRTRLYPDGRRVDEVLIRGAGPLWVEWGGAISPGIRERLAPQGRVVLVGEYTPGGDDAPPSLTGAELALDAGNHAVKLATYGLDGVSDRDVRSAIVDQLRRLDDLRDPLPDSYLAPLKLPTLPEALRDAHLRGDPAARRRLAFDEALVAVLAGAAQRYSGGRERGIAHNVVHGLASRLGERHGLVLDDRQQMALEAIKRDLRRHAPMLRVITGDVAAGKGLVSLLAAVVVAESKSQVLYLAHDVPSAEMRYLFIEPMLRDVGLVARLLPDAPTGAQRDAIRRGEVHIVFGTPHLLEADLEFRRLGMVVGEERTILRGTSIRVAEMRAPRPDTLVMHPTPLRTIDLLGAYVDHDVTRIAGEPLPEVETVVLPAGERESAYARAAERVAAGDQVLVLFPLVRGEELLDARDAMRIKAALEGSVLEGARIALMHGAMPREERHRVHDDFRHRRADVLIATSCVEDGPPIAAATVAIVEQADKLDFHRALRIRRFLGGDDPTCLFVLGQDAQPDGVERLERLAASGDDLALAEEFTAVQVLGDPAPDARFRWLDPAADREVLLAAHVRAHAMLAIDGGLRRGAHAEINRAARHMWQRLSDAPPPLPEPKSGGGGRRRRRRRKRR